MNRLQSSDFKTYAALSSAPVADFPEMRPKTDMEEMRIMAAAQGLGDPIYERDNTDDDDFGEFLSEIGQ